MNMIFLLCHLAGMIVGHVPHEVSTRHGGSIICEVIGHRRLGKTAWIDHGLTMQQFGRGQHLCACALMSPKKPPPNKE